MNLFCFSQVFTNQQCEEILQFSRIPFYEFYPILFSFRRVLLCGYEIQREEPVVRTMDQQSTKQNNLHAVRYA